MIGVARVDGDGNDAPGHRGSAARATTVRLTMGNAERTELHEAKLAVQLWFDVTAPMPVGVAAADDVRKLTQDLIFFVMPRDRGPNDPPTSSPGVRFRWGSFQFDGIMESMEESVELFSAEGRPLRASVAIALSQQKITEFNFALGVKDPPAVTRQGRPAPGTAPLSEAPAGSNLQSMAANQPGGTGGAAGLNGGWQAIASANGIENPRLLQPGQLIDLHPPSLSVSVGVDGTLSAGAQIG